MALNWAGRMTGLGDRAPVFGIARVSADAWATALAADPGASQIQTAKHLEKQTRTELERADKALAAAANAHQKTVATAYRARCAAKLEKAAAAVAAAEADALPALQRHLEANVDQAAAMLAALLDTAAMIGDTLDAAAKRADAAGIPAPELYGNGQLIAESLRHLQATLKVGG